MGNRLLQLGRTERHIASERLSLYLDDQLSPSQRERVEAHLGGCEACREDLRTLRWTRDLLKEAPVLELPRSFVIREADVQRRQPSRRSAFAIQWATVAVAILLLLVFAGDILTGTWLVNRAQPMVPAYGLASQGQAAEAEKQGTAVVEKEVTKAVEKEVVVTQAERAAQAPEASLPPTEGIQEAQPVEEGTEAAAAEGAVTPTPGMLAQKAGATTPSVEGTPAPPMAMRAATSAPEGTPLPEEGTALADQSAAATPKIAAAESVTEAEPPTVAPAPHQAGAETEELPPMVTPGGVPEQPSGTAARTPLMHLGWRIVEMVLVIALLGLVFAAIWARRKSSRF
jgi:anti-sigma factor RsiW